MGKAFLSKGILMRTRLRRNARRPRICSMKNWNRGNWILNRYLFFKLELRILILRLNSRINSMKKLGKLFRLMRIINLEVLLILKLKNKKDYKD